MLGSAFDITFSYWPSALLALGPAIFNIYVLYYIYVKLPQNKLTNIFGFTVLCILGWQLLDGILRLSGSMEMAELWLRTLWISVLMVTPVAMHFVLHFTDNGHLLKKTGFLLLLYGPAVLFEALFLLNINQLQILNDSFWNFTILPAENFISILPYMWITLNSLLITTILITHLIYTKTNTRKYYQALLLSIGFFVPIVQGVTTQFLMPYFFDTSDIPITSSFLSSFSIVSLIALSRFNLFRFSPEHASNEILATMNDGLCVVNSENKIRFVNKSFCELTGYSTADLDEFNYADLLSEESFDNYTLEISKLKAYEREGQFELEFVTKTGQKRWVLMTITPFLAEKQQETGYIKIHRDITERKQYISQIKRKSKELSTFFYRTSHDLRGPLTSIMGLVGMLKQEDLQKAEIDKLVEMLEISTDKLDAILEQLINVAEINEGTPDPQAIDVKGVIRSAIAAAKQYTDKSVQMEVVDELKKPSKIDKNYLWQVAYHVIKNAVQFNDKEVVVVDIRLWESMGHLKMEIADNGPGIREDIQPYIYDMFYRGDQKLSGSGLGLYLVEKALQKLNGRIEFQSNSQGTTFTVTIPIFSTTKEMAN